MATIKIADFIGGCMVDAGVPFGLSGDDGGVYQVTVTGEFLGDNAVTLQRIGTFRSETVRIFTERGQQLLQLRRGTYQVLIENMADAEIDTAIEIIDRHWPPLAITPENVDPDYAPGWARLTISCSGHVLEGAADLAAVALHGISIPALITVEN